MLYRVWLIAGAVSALICLAFAAYVSHRLGAEFAPFIRETVNTAREIHFVHALALIAVGILTMRANNVFLHLAGAAFLVGTIFFCGGLYGSADPSGQFDAFKPVIPIGGMTLMAGWALFAVGAGTLKVSS